MMEDTLQITFHGLDHSDAVEARIRDKAATLERMAQQVVGMHVTVDAPNARHHKGTLYSVRIDVRLPNGALAVSRTHRHDHSHEDVYAAIRDAFDAATRQVESHIRRQRGMVKRHDQGSLSWHEEVTGLEEPPSSRTARA
jgi:ribosomal subunit interface protein